MKHVSYLLITSPLLFCHLQAMESSEKAPFNDFSDEAKVTPIFLSDSPPKKRELEDSNLGVDKQPERKKVKNKKVITNFLLGCKYLEGEVVSQNVE